MVSVTYSINYVIVKKCDGPDVDFHGVDVISPVLFFRPGNLWN